MPAEIANIPGVETSAFELVFRCISSLWSALMSICIPGTSVPILGVFLAAWLLSIALRFVLAFLGTATTSSVSDKVNEAHRLHDDWGGRQTKLF